MKSLVRKQQQGETNGSTDADSLKHKLLATVFYEASTRTSCSFQAAISRLGGKFIHIDASGSGSSTKKGESLRDTIRCLECYADVTVLRHFEKGSVGHVAEHAMKPVINAGDGVGEHPTQALVDVFTMMDELGLLNDKKGVQNFENRSLTVCMVGDLKHGRTVHSLAKLLARSEGLGLGLNITLRYCSPPSLSMPQDVREQVAKSAFITQQQDYTDLSSAVDGSDVLYATRIQKERFDSEAEYNSVYGAYIVDPSLMNAAPHDIIVMHPLPRLNEICPEVDSDPRAAYFRQMENGMFVRMALLSLILANKN